MDIDQEFKVKFPDRNKAAGVANHFASIFHRATMEASGYEPGLLAAFGQEQDTARAKRFGRLVLLLASIAAVSWASKTWNMFSGPTALLFTPLAAFAAAAVVLLLDGHFGSEQSLFDKPWVRARRVAGRLVIVLLEAVFAAGPLCLSMMSAPIDVELQRLRSDTVTELNARAAVAHDIAGRTAAREKSKGEVEAAREAALILPSAIVDEQQLAESCRTDMERLRLKNLAEADRLTNEFAGLDRIIHSDADQAVIQRAQARKDYIKRRAMSLATEVSDKRKLCNNQQLAFEDARKRYIDEATAVQDQAVKRLRESEESLARATASYNAEASRSADVVGKSLGSRNLAYEVEGMIRVLKSDGTWIGLLSVIYCGFAVLSALPVLLRSTIKPGAYDAHRNTVLARELMRAQTQYLGDLAYHEAVRSELQSQKTLDEIRRRAAEDVACGHIGRGLGDWFANGGGRAPRPAAAA